MAELHIDEGCERCRAAAALACRLDPSLVVEERPGLRAVELVDDEGQVLQGGDAVFGVIARRWHRAARLAGCAPLRSTANALYRVLAPHHRR